MKDVQCYELFGGMSLKNHAFLIISNSDTILNVYTHRNRNRNVKHCNS